MNVIVVACSCFHYSAAAFQRTKLSIFSHHSRCLSFGKHKLGECFSLVGKYMITVKILTERRSKTALRVETPGGQNLFADLLTLTQSWILLSPVPATVFCAYSNGVERA